MTNSADPDQLAADLDLLCLQIGKSGLSRTRVKAFRVFLMRSKGIAYEFHNIIFHREIKYMLEY